MMNQIWTLLSNQVASNAFFTGGALLGVLGLLAAYFRSIPSIINQWIQARVVIELDIPDRDESFEWLDYWLSQQKYQKKCRLLTISTGKKKNKQRQDFQSGPLESDTDRGTPVCLSPAPGLHYFFYKHRFIILRRERRDAQVSTGSLSVGYRETFYLKCFTRNRKIITDLLEEARELFHPPEDNRLSIFVPSYGDWVRSTKKFPRSLDSVVLPKDNIERLLNNLTQFQQSEAWYADLGIPYRIGVLLYGPPGNGKSSLVTAIASKMQLDVCILNLSSFGMSDENATNLINNLPEKSILLLEDVDCLYQSREKKDAADSITFSGLLNAIDGVLAGDNRILFLTTNHRDKLDAALIRPGRCDIHMLIDNATPGQAEQLFRRFFPSDESLAVSFGLAIEGVTVCMAELQGILLENRTNPEMALTKLNLVVQLKVGDGPCTTEKTI